MTTIDHFSAEDSAMIKSLAARDTTIEDSLIEEERGEVRQAQQ